jgi:capsular exopolysaccharide synthesis family protein
MTAISEEIVNTSGDGPQSSGLRTLEKASPWTATRIDGPAPADPILSSVESGPQRLLAGGAIGLLLGIAGLLLFEVLSARLRDVGAVESATRLPVIAEIPEVKLTRAEWFRVLTAEEPSGLVAEAYRSLRTSMLAMWQRHPAHGVPGAGNGNAGSHAAPPLRSLLVTSSSPAEGKSVTAVNLAAGFAETGSTVIVLDADFRRPQLDRYFSRPTTPNLGDLIPLGDDVTAQQLETVLQESGIPGVRFAASAPPKSQPAAAMTTAKAAARAAVELADIVILDSPPLLLANDAADLTSVADATVLLVRSGWTRRSAAGRAADLLRRLEATVIGTVLVGVQHSPRTGYYGYYGYYGYGYQKPEQAQLRHRLLPWKRTRSARRDADLPPRAEVGAVPRDAGEQGERPEPWN